MVPPALNGHAASSNDHAGAVNSIGLHVLGASLWVGGIAVLALISGLLARPVSGTPRRDITAATLKRFSALALFCFVLVTASGIISASIRITSWHNLFYSPYGQLVLVKTFCALVLGAIGYMHRSWIIPRLGDDDGAASRGKAAAVPSKGSLTAQRVLWQIIGVELLVMAATSAVAVALSSSAPPSETKYSEDASPAFSEYLVSDGGAEEDSATATALVAARTSSSTPMTCHSTRWAVREPFDGTAEALPREAAPSSSPSRGMIHERCM
ncbi:CopD family protein [Arthrobacter sp.]|uniref:copper resistance D family protein n=1 Tax=Arthrobacter sp. TaxID=1667 RepID=UPI00258F386B|nr:CopD family protein [Arthrobacter sp.]